MLKKCVFLVSMLIFITNICHAETSSIVVEENSPNAATFSVHETTASPFGRLGKAFFKHIDDQGNAHYWIRLALGGDVFLYYQIRLIIDEDEYILRETPKPQKYQTASTSRMIMFSKRPGARNYYDVSEEVIEKLITAGNITMIYSTQSSNDKSKSWNKGMIKKVKQIIGLTYNDKNSYHHG